MSARSRRAQPTVVHKGLSLTQAHSQPHTWLTLRPSGTDPVEAWARVQRGLSTWHGPHQVWRGRPELLLQRGHAV